jgi:hypothetical protein
VLSAVELLLRDNHLAADARSIWIPGLPAAQCGAQPSAAKLEGPAPETGRTAHARTSTERVRQYRDRVRAGNAGGVSVGVSSPVSPPVSSVTSGVSPAVPGCVSSSRGDGQNDPSENRSREKDEQNDHPPLKRARPRDGVSSSASRNASAVSAGVPADPGIEEDEGEEALVLRVPKDLEEALRLPVGQRAALVLEKSELALGLHPERWPEVIGVASALAESIGLVNPCLGRYADDEGVRAVVRLYAAGFTQLALEYVARIVPKQPWWSSDGNRLGLSSLSIEVVRRNLPAADGRARILSPRVAKALASVEREPGTADGAA